MGVVLKYGEGPSRSLMKNQYQSVMVSLFFLQLLGPEDMINPHVDELSMMTYLSQFPDAKLKDGAPLKARADPLKVGIAAWCALKCCLGPYNEGGHLCISNSTRSLLK